MTFKLHIPLSNTTALDLSVAPGEILFVLGPNGSGKSSLIHHFYTANHVKAQRIHAHRQTSFHSGLSDLNPLARQRHGQLLQSYERQPNARWLDQVSGERPKIAIYDLVDKENQLGREVKARVYVGDLENAKRHLDENKSPLQVISELLRLSNIPIEISVASDSCVIAQKAGGSEYDIAQLSDGERNALLIAAEVLTARPGTLLLIDEPERHLHRSIISPLLTQLFAHRPDCTFVVSTHEVNLPLDHPNVSTLLVRNCSYTGTNITAWEASLVSPGIDIDEEIKRDILGSRSKILFVEGTGQSLDKPLYSLLFPNVSVVAKSSCRDVEQSVTGIRNSTDLHWVQAFGIVDNDRRPQDDLDDLKAKGIYAVPFYSVESIYYHPKIQERIAKRQAATNGTDAAKSLNDAKTAVLSAVKQKVEHLSARVAEKAIREALLKYLPKQKDIGGCPGQC